MLCLQPVTHSITPIIQLCHPFTLLIAQSGCRHNILTADITCLQIPITHIRAKDVLVDKDYVT